MIPFRVSFCFVHLYLHTAPTPSFIATTPQNGKDAMTCLIVLFLVWIVVPPKE